MIKLYEPRIEDLWFKEKMLSDDETMSYNHAYGGTIPFPKRYWIGWYNKWIKNHNGKRFYRYIKYEDTFVGEVAYHFDEEKEVVTDYVEEKLSVASPIFSLGFKETWPTPERTLKEELLGNIILEAIAGNTSDLYKELIEKGENVTYEEVLSLMTKRDDNDKNRKIAPAVAAEDAILFDNTEYGLEESIQYVSDLAKKRFGL